MRTVREVWVHRRDKFPISPEMVSSHVSQFYAITAGGILGAIIVARLVFVVIKGLKDHALVFFLQHVLCPFSQQRHRLLGPWTRASLIFQAVYWSANIVCLSYKVLNLSDAGMGAGTLSLINLIPLYSGLHLSFLSDMFGLSVRIYTKLHGSIGVISGALATFHAGVALASGRNLKHSSGTQLYGLIVSPCTSSKFSTLTLLGRGLHNLPLDPLSTNFS